MNVLFVSQCSKRALTETRRILDLFAERRGDRTWQTPITQQGLDTLRRLLRKTARKNTAVAAHWIRGRDHSELMWIVGDAGQFNAQGAVPTNMTKRDVLRKNDENDWHSAEAIRLLAATAALFHDFGKANELFQAKLQPDCKDGRLPDPYRHEWVSLRMFEAFVGPDHQGSDADWLARLASIADMPDAAWMKRLRCDGLVQAKATEQAYPLQSMPPIAQAIGWLIVTHHRLPTPAIGASLPKAEHLSNLLRMIDASWCGARTDSTEARVKKVWKFKPTSLPHRSNAWAKCAHKVAQRLQACSSLRDGRILDNAYVMHLARLCLVLGDHHYSSQGAQPGLGDTTHGAYANTDPNGQLKQKLDEHLIGVEKSAIGIAHALTKAEHTWPRLTRHRGFKRRSADPRFAWQDKAFDMVTALQDKAAQHGFFGVNMASTGGGKTLANARIAYALADPQRGTRFCVALGLRTLTLQTGQAYRDRLGLTDEDLAVLVGGTSVRQLFEHQQAKDEARSPIPGSESSKDLMPDNTHVHFSGAITPGPLSEWLAQGSRGGSAGRNAQKLLQAPVLVCTIDHLMPATESTRGGSHIIPMLRLMSSDLILDEPDDFDLSDLPALSRLVHWAGLLGSRVLLSSATLAPAIVEGLFAAYAAGRQTYQANRGQPGLPVDVCCAWFDEFGTQASNHTTEASFATAHQQFAQKRAGKLSGKEVRRRARILPLDMASCPDGQVRQGVAKAIHQELFTLHKAHHTVHPTSGQRVSFGLVRMANVDPLIDVARALLRLPAPGAHRVHLCVYHSRHPLSVRSAIEARLDRVLQRHDPQAIFKDDEMRHALAAQPELDHLFVVLASPVCEVGRDHDYDWAIVEPSSMRSIIQLAGRVRRHREGVIDEPNIVLLNTNCRALESTIGPAFMWPGFESKKHLLTSHRLTDLLRAEELEVIDARSRIVPPKSLAPKDRLVDLEHHCLGMLMSDIPAAEQNQYNLRRWWTTPTALSAVDQRATPFREDPQGHEDFVLMPDDEGEHWSYLRVEDDGQTSSQQNRIDEVRLPPCAPGMQTWGEADYLQGLMALAEDFSLSPEASAMRFGTVQLQGKDGTQRWAYHPWLGFRRAP